MRPEASAATRRTTTRSRSPARRDAQRPRSGRVRWPTGSRHLALVSVDLQAKLRRDNGHAARLWMADRRQNEVARVARGALGPTGYRHYSWRTRGHGSRQLVASLSCQSKSRCPQSDLAKTWVRNVRLKVADYSDPRFTALDGTLLGSRLASRLARTCTLRPAIQAAASADLIVTVNGDACSPASWSLRHDPGHLLRGALRAVLARSPVAQRTLRTPRRRPSTTARTASRSAQSTSPATAPAAPAP